MSLYSTWPYLGLLATALLLLSLDRPFRIIDLSAARSSQRFVAIDGMRGLLAFSVFVHHAAVMPDYLRTGLWAAPPSDFYALLGETGVALFFAVTGFLFWGKLLQEKGTPDWRKLYIGRVFRIAPLYLAAVLVLFFIVWNRSNFELREPVEAVLLDTVRWMGLGLLGQPDVNAYRHTGHLMAGVVWTLRYEWLFYFSLPLLALFARGNASLWFPPAGLAACLGLHAYSQGYSAFYASLFFCGMISASLMHRGYAVRSGNTVALPAALLCLLALFTQFSTATGFIQAILLGLVFYIISSGNTILGLLESRGAQRLGKISYGVYLIHGLVLATVFSMEPARAYAASDNVGYWLTIALCSVLVLVTATAGFLFIEQPGIRLGQLAASALSGERPVNPPSAANPPPKRP